MFVRRREAVNCDLPLAAVNFYIPLMREKSVTTVVCNWSITR